MDSKKRSFEKVATVIGICSGILVIAQVILILSLDYYGDTRLAFGYEAIFVFVIIFSVVEIIVSCLLCLDSKNESQFKSGTIFAIVLLIISLFILVFEIAGSVMSCSMGVHYEFIVFSVLACLPLVFVIFSLSFIEKASEKIKKVRKENSRTNKEPQADNITKEIEKLANFREMGLLTEEQYRAAVDRVIQANKII